MCGEVDDEPLPHGRWGFLGLPVDTMLPLLGMVAIDASLPRMQSIFRDLQNSPSWELRCLGYLAIENFRGENFLFFAARYFV